MACFSLRGAVRGEAADEWEQIELMYGWPEQRDYELIRPLKLFKALGFGTRVLHVFNSAETGYEKPHPEAYP